MSSFLVVATVVLNRKINIGHPTLLPTFQEDMDSVFFHKVH